MPEFTAKDVQALRQATGAGMMDAKKALQENDGDTEAAVQVLLAEGPPGEEVGMDAYSLDPALNPHPAADAEFLEGARQ